MSLDIRRSGALRVLAGLLMLAGVVICLLYLRNSVLDQSLTFEPTVSLIAWVAGCYAGALLFSAMSWRQLVFAGSKIEVSWRNALLGMAALVIGKYLPGKVAGVVGRAATLSRHASPSTAASLALIEQAYVPLGFVSFAALAGIALLGNPIWIWVLAATMLAALIGPVVVRLILSRVPFARRFTTDALGVLAGLGPRIGLRLLILASLGAAAASLVSWFAPDLIGIEVNASARAAVLTFYPAAIVAGMLTLVLPGGIGAREGAFVLMVQPWVTLDDALALAAILRLLNVAADLLVGIAGLLFLIQRADAPSNE